MIELCGVTKRFGTKCAVDRLDLEVRPGELFAFLGPNGAGKTTTIKMICGLLSPNSGTVRVGGFDASSQQARQLLGYVPDQPYLYDKLTGREFLKFVVEMYGLDRQRSARRIEELVETFEMSDYADELCENVLAGDEAARGVCFGAGSRPQGAGRRRAAGRSRPAQRPDRQGPVHLAGAIGLHGLDVDASAGDRRRAGGPDRHRGSRQDAGRRHARGASRCSFSIAGRSRSCS